MLRRLVREEGRRWRKIADSFPGRSVASVRNHWLRIEQGERDVAERNYKNRCTACGQPKRVGHRCVMLKVRASAHGSPAGTGFSDVDTAEPPRVRCAAGWPDGGSVGDGNVGTAAVGYAAGPRGRGRSLCVLLPGSLGELIVA